MRVLCSLCLLAGLHTGFAEIMPARPPKTVLKVSATAPSAYGSSTLLQEVRAPLPARDRSALLQQPRPRSRSPAGARGATAAAAAAAAAAATRAAGAPTRRGDWGSAERLLLAVARLGALACVVGHLMDGGSQGSAPYLLNITILLFAPRLGGSRSRR